ncbi:MFS transporter [Cellulomonas composti]|uniref:MFS transporter n=1 Tax=Cellulomonas composti TaxID=266130 RepID=A0A511JCQ1_9CELL|nr:MFS transporter [Cellulomonas composti]GEL95752.1 MFS transporter [Cellulomonas composti]
MTPAAHRARVAGSLAFGVQGLVLAMILTSLDSFKSRYGIGDLTISATILGVCVMAGLGTVVADQLARRVGGSRGALRLGLVLVAVAVVLIATAPEVGLLFVGFGVYGLALGMVDAGTNMQAVAVQAEYGRPLLTGFYASWSAGGILGTLAIAVSSGRIPDDPVAWTIGVGTVLALAAAVVVGRGSLRPTDVTVVPVQPRADAPAPVIPWAPLLLLGLGVAAYYVNDQAVSTWSPIFVHEVFGEDGTITKLGYAVYLCTALGSRLVGDACVRRWGRGHVVRAASLIGAAGLLVVLVSRSPWQAVVGFAIAGAGLGLIAPLCFSAAGRLAPGHADAVVARLNNFNYLGAVLGGVIVGVVGNASSSMRWGFAIPAVLVVVVAVLAGRFDSLGGHEHDAGEGAPEGHASDEHAGGGHASDEHAGGAALAATPTTPGSDA